MSARYGFALGLPNQAEHHDEAKHFVAAKLTRRPAIRLCGRSYRRSRLAASGVSDFFAIRKGPHSPNIDFFVSLLELLLGPFQELGAHLIRLLVILPPRDVIPAELPGK
jgi:hypothetical protein